MLTGFHRTNKPKREKQKNWMAMDMNIATISLLLLLASTAFVAQSADFDVTSYGAKPGADIAQVYIISYHTIYI
jgi:hypothetical protein